jgi:hypothetical protein
LPLSVEVCTPVSETGRAGALPTAAANIDAHFNNEQTPHPRNAVAVCGGRVQMMAARKCFYD